MQIRLEFKGGKHSSLMFCTNGVLLRKLVGSGGAGEATGDSVWDETVGLDATHVIVVKSILWIGLSDFEVH